MHRQPADAATCAHGHARAIGDRNGRGGQHAGADTYSIAIPDSYSHCYSHRDPIAHADCFTAAYCNTHTTPNANCHADAESNTVANRNTVTHGHADSLAYANTVADSHSDADTATEPRRAARCPCGILHRNRRRQLDEQRRLALRHATGPMARS